MIETPVALDQGISRRRDMMWGWVGAIVGSAVGVGSAAVAIFVEGANAYQSSPYPPFFTKRQLLAYDLFLAAVVVVGAIFAVGAIVLARRSHFPRTDAMGGMLAGTILLLLGAALLFTRLVALIRGS
ncbi:MAG: hypothetical protein AUH85_08570 [Chloroflexi bacterium 13_1_40CM_4_68_4]|nr:MAG: hypothetical protein AUH85_08570 [Chloroflexi bacterium 13_1_40CM_4_68_4]